MESNSDQETIDNKYIILEKKGHGATANVFCVKDFDHDTVYAAKILKKHSDYFDKEVNILNTLKTANNPYIVNIVGSGEGLIVRKNHPQTTNQYLVLEYASKGELFNYIYCAKCGLSERHSKVIFAKILKGVQACHSKGICHRDLKMQNILVDADFNPKICDFGFATDNNDHLTEFLGTQQYAAPEILRNRAYDGFKADIFSLGVVLITLTTCKIGFGAATKYDPYYRLIMAKHIQKYWTEVEKHIKGMSQELKDLFIKMVAFKPNERPTIEEIFASPWMKEIRDLNEEQLAQLENEIREDFLKRETAVNEVIKQEMEVENDDSMGSSGNRSGNDEEIYFDLSLKPKYAQTGLNMDNYIKLKGTLTPAKFMNSLANKINKEYNNECLIETNKEKLKFNVVFEENQTEEEIPEDLAKELKELGIDEDEEENENNNIKRNDTIIQIKIFESLNGGYLLRFLRKGGEQKDYLDKIGKISALIKKMI